MSIRNIEVLLEKTNIQVYRKSLVETYGPELLTATINDVTFHLEPDVGNDVVNLKSNRPCPKEDALTFEVWLAVNIDVHQVALERAMVSQFGFNLAYAQCNIVDYINDLTDLYIWLRDNPTVDGYSHDFSECPLPVVKDALETFVLIDNQALRDCIDDNDGEIDLYGVGDVGGIVCKCSVWGQVSIFDELYGTVFIPPQPRYLEFTKTTDSYFAHKNCTPVYLAMDTSRLTHVQHILHTLYSAYRLRGIQKLMSKH